jgi:F-type H+-transporting ATPase subunit delta
MSTNKSFSTETSERYSRALFEISQESNELNKIENDIQNFKLIYDTNLDVRNFIKDPSQMIAEQNKLVNLISDKFNFSKNFKKFLLLLIEKRRIFFVSKIIESFLRLCSKKRGEVKASLISSKELSQIELNDISKDLSKSTGLILKFDFKVDKELIGGLKLQLGSIMIDTSIRNKLKKYEQVMLEN